MTDKLSTVFIPTNNYPLILIQVGMSDTEEMLNRSPKTVRLIKAKKLEIEIEFYLILPFEDDSTAQGRRKRSWN